MVIYKVLNLAYITLSHLEGKRVEVDFVKF